MTFCPYGQGGAVCRQNICNHVAAFVIPFNLICMKKFNFDLLTPRSSWEEGGGGAAGKIFPTMFLHFVIPFYLIFNMTIFRLVPFVHKALLPLRIFYADKLSKGDHSRPYSEKVEF